MTPISKAPKIFNLWIVIATIVAGLSLYNLTLRTFEVGPTPVLADLLRYYRVIAHGLFRDIPSSIGIEVSEKLAEGWALSFLLAGCIGRAFIILASPIEEFARKRFIVVVFVSIILAGITMAPAMIAAFSQLAFFHPRYRKEAINILTKKTPENRTRGPELVVTLSMIYWFASLGVMFGFFAISAYAPSAS